MAFKGIVPQHGYSLTLVDGREVVMDVSNKEDFLRVTSVMQAGEKTAAWFDDRGVATEITDVFDCETEDHLDPLTWAEEDVFIYHKYYGEPKND